MEELWYGTRVNIFISYAFKDRQLKDQLLSDLVDPALKQCAVLWDGLQIRASADWENTILNQMRDSVVILLLITENFLASDYCMQKELPAAREFAAGNCLVLEIRLTQEQLPASERGNIRVWPIGQCTPEQARKLLSDLQLTIKRRVVEELKNPTRMERARDGENEGKDRLARLHQHFGTARVASRDKGLLAGLGALLGAGTGAVLTGLLPFSELSGVGSTMIYAMLLWSSAKLNFIILSVFRPDRDGPSFVGLLSIILWMGAAAILSGLLEGAAFGTVAGVILRFTESDFQVPIWQGAFLGAASSAGACWLHNRREQRFLQIFVDVGDRTHSSPGFDPSAAREDDSIFAETRAAIARLASGVADTPPEEAADEPEAPDEAVPDAAEIPDEAEGPAVAEPLQPGEDEPKSPDWKPWVLADAAQSPSDVRRPTLLVWHEEDDALHEELQLALRTEGVADILAVTAVRIPAASSGRDIEWPKDFQPFECCIVLVTAKLIAVLPESFDQQWATTVSESIGRHLLPVLCEELGPDVNHPLRRVQALPGDGLPVSHWPIRQPAWIRTVRQVRDDLIIGFKLDLERFHERKLWQRYDAQSMASDLDRVSQVIRYEKATRVPAFLPMRLPFPYRVRTFDIKGKLLITWATGCGLLSVLADIGHIHVDTGGWRIAAVAVQCLIPAAFLIFVASRRELWRWTRLTPARLIDSPRILEYLIGYPHGISTAQRRWIVWRMAFGSALALIPLAAWIATTLATRRSAGWLETLLIGGMVGIVAALLTTRRSPKVLLETKPPGHEDLHVLWRAASVTVLMPQTWRVKRATKEGRFRAPPKSRIPGESNYALRFSIRDLVVAALQTLLISIPCFFVLAGGALARANFALVLFSSVGLSHILLHACAWYEDRELRRRLYKLLRPSFSRILWEWIAHPALQGALHYAWVTGIVLAPFWLAGKTNQTWIPLWPLVSLPLLIFVKRWWFRVMRASTVDVLTN